MVVGNGLVANVVREISFDGVFFASGVSNSLETNQTEFEREKQLIEFTLNTYPDLLFVYFSTCSIYDSSVNYRPYVQHKLKMEELIQYSGNQFLIFRISNLVGRGGNPNTIMNFLVHAVVNKNQFDVWQNATRNLLSIDDFKYIAEQFIHNKSFNQIINIAYHSSYSILDIVERIETFSNTKANYTLIKDKGKPIHIDTKMIYPYLLDLDKKRQEANYLDYLLNTYFSGLR